MKRTLFAGILILALMLTLSSSVLADEGGPELSPDSQPSLVSETAPGELKEGAVPAAALRGANAPAVETSDLEVVSIIVTVTHNFRPAQPAAVNDAGMIQLVRKYYVPFAYQRRNRG